MFIKLIRLGRDAELRSTPNGKQVCGFAGAYDIGFGDKKRAQWIDCSLWGDRAEKVVNHLTKGTQIVICGDDLETEQYQKGDGTQGFKLKCRVVSFDFAGSKPESTQQPHVQAPYQQPVNGQQQQQAPQQQPPNAMDGFMDDDPNIPF